MNVRIVSANDTLGCLHRRIMYSSAKRGLLYAFIVTCVAALTRVASGSDTFYEFSVPETIAFFNTTSTVQNPDATTQLISNLFENLLYFLFAFIIGILATVSSAQTPSNMHRMITELVLAISQAKQVNKSLAAIDFQLADLIGSDSAYHTTLAHMVFKFYETSQSQSEHMTTQLFVSIQSNVLKIQEVRNMILPGILAYAFKGLYIIVIGICIPAYKHESSSGGLLLVVFGVSIVYGCLVSMFERIHYEVVSLPDRYLELHNVRV